MYHGLDRIWAEPRRLKDLASGAKWGKDVPGKESKGKNVEFGTVRNQADQRTSFVFRRIKKIKLGISSSFLISEPQFHA